MTSRFIEDENLDVEIVENFYNVAESHLILTELKALQYETLNFNFGGKIFTPRRLVAGFADPGIHYEFSGNTVTGRPWTSLLLRLKNDVEKKTGEVYNFALLNFYPDGLAYISNHQDNEDCLNEKSAIPTLSFGANRRMLFKRSSSWTYSVNLNNGSLAIMKAPTNQYWNHGIPVMKDVKDCRISVTFRHIMPSCEPELKKQKKNNQPLKDVSNEVEKSDTAFTDESSTDFSTDSSVSAQSDTSSTAGMCCIETFDSLPVNDWLDDHLKTENPNYSSKSLKKWNLEGDCFMTVELSNQELYLQIYESETKYVKIDIKSFYYFQKKIYNFNLMYRNSSFIANNTIAVFNNNGSCIIQCINSCGTNGFQLEAGLICLNSENLKTLCELLHEVQDFFITSIFHDLLPVCLGWGDLSPANAFPQGNISDITRERLLTNLIPLVKDELEQVVGDVYECEGCIVNHPSQTKHECITRSLDDRIIYLGECLFLFINVDRIAEKLNKKRLLSPTHIYCIKDIEGELFAKRILNTY